MTFTTARRSVLALLAALLLAPASAGADPTLHETLREFYRTGKWIIYISNEEQKDARIYHSRRAGAFLILDSGYEKPLLIEPREKLVSALPEDKVVERKDKGLDIAADVEKEELGTFRFDGGDVAIDVDGLVARLQQRPYLLGMHQADELLLHTPEYEPGMKKYEPAKGDLEALKAADKPLEVVVFFGTWCPTCRRLLPLILKVDQALEGSKIDIRYYGLPKGKSAMSRDPEVVKHGIQRIPTGVVFVDGKAVGEISSNEWSRPERALKAALDAQ
jgi:thiol-disulfide isomerase/thioredoxin